MSVRRSAFLFCLTVALCSSLSAQDVEAEKAASDTVGADAPMAPDDVADPADGDEAVADTTHGSLTIRSVPADALVIVDGFPIGSTPVRVDSLPAGEHRLQVAMDGYFTRSATVVVRGGRNQKATFELTAPSSLIILSDPADAVISLNGEQSGRTPHVADMLRPGTYAVRVAAEGFPAYDTTLALAAGSVDTVRAVFEPAVTAAPAESAPTEEQTPESSRTGRRVAAIAAAALFGVFALVVLLVDVTND